MSSTNRRVLVPSQGSWDFSIDSATKKQPSEGEILVKVKAISLNPADYKQIEYGLFVESWPAVVGSEAAGVVDAVGEGVKGLKVGDEVFGIFMGGVYQEYATTKENMVMRKPASASFKDVVGLSISTLTAWSAIYTGLGISIAKLVPGTAETGNKPKSILVLGGSSLVGSSAIVALRRIDSSVTILTTSSSHHHSHLRGLGANEAFDQESGSLIADVRKATQNGEGVDAILDAVQGLAQRTELLDVLSPSGLKLVEEVPGGPSAEEAAKAKGANFAAKGGFDIFSAQGGFGTFSAIENMVKDGQLKIPMKVEVAGHGLESLKGALERLKKGVSGTKFVVEL